MLLKLILTLLLFLTIVLVVAIAINPKIVAMPFNRLVEVLEDDKAKEVFIDNIHKPSLFSHSKVLETEWENIRDEAVSMFASSRNIGKNVYSGLERQEEDFWTGWDTCSLRLFGQDNVNASHRCPHLWSLIKDQPEINTVLLSKMAPEKIIRPHSGPYQGVLRYHLALTVPKDEQPFIMLADQKYEWKEGVGQMFNECHRHYAVNPSKTEERIILFLDIKRKFDTPILNIFNDINLGIAKHIPFIGY